MSHDEHDIHVLGEPAEQYAEAAAKPIQEERLARWVQIVREIVDR